MTLQIPVLSTINWPALLISFAAAISIFRFKIGMIPTLAVCSALGALNYFIFA